MMRGLLWFGLGAGLMYFTDPRNGRRRRAQLLDQATHLRSVERSLVGKARRDLAHRLTGFVRKVRPGQTTSDDEIIAERVRAAIGRVASHPHALDVEVHGGKVALRGPILADEAQVALRAAAVRGVSEVLDRLERHHEAGRIPALQGTPRRPNARGEWTPATRLVAAGAGVALVATGVRRSVLLEMLGSALVVRAVANRPMRQVFGIGEGFDVLLEKTITIHAPTDKVYELAKRLDSLPKFLEHVRRVQIQDGNREHSHWVVDGPFGREVCFDAKVTHSDKDRVLAWTSEPDEAAAHCGVIHFEPVVAGTRVHIQMHYAPRGGVVGHLLSRVLGFDPRSRMTDDLVRMKSLLEDGRTHAHRQLVTRDSLDV
jgi:uncharacterized membrane protein